MMQSRREQNCTNNKKERQRRDPLPRFGLTIVNLIQMPVRASRKMQLRTPWVQREQGL